MLIEYVLGITSDAKNKEIVWRIGLTEKHGIERYPFEGKSVDLICEAREDKCEEPHVTAKCDAPVNVRIIWEGGEKTVSTC